MTKLSDLRVLLVADSGSVMSEESFKSGLYPEIFKIFQSLFGKTKICFGDDTIVYDNHELSNVKRKSKKSGLKERVINRLLHFLEIFIGRNTYTEKYYYRHLLNNLMFEFDLVVSITSTSHAGVLGYLISKKFGIPFIILEHKTHYQRGLIRFWHKRLIRHVQLSAKIVAPVSESLEISLKKFNPGIKTQVVYNPIGLEMFENISSPLMSRLNDFANDNYCFGAWTTWRKIKRLDLLLDAFSELKLKSERPCKLIVGGSSVNAEQVSRMRKDPDILFLGPLDRQEIHSLSAFVDCCVVCSDHETFGLPIAEAMAQGTPVIATKSGGVEDLIDESRGLVIKSDNLPALVIAMKLMTEKNFFSNSKIKQFARDKFSSESIRKIWLNLLSNHL